MTRLHVLMFLLVACLGGVLGSLGGEALHRTMHPDHAGGVICRTEDSCNGTIDYRDGQWTLTVIPVIP